MSIQQTFISSPAIYGGDGQCPLTWPTISYNHYLCENGRHFAWGNFQFFGGGLAVFPSSRPNSDFEIWAFGNFDMIYWPSWYGGVFKWDGTTGEFISFGPFAYSSGLSSLPYVKQDRSGVVWATYTFYFNTQVSMLLFKQDPNNLDSGLAVIGTYPLNWWGGSNLGVFGPDMLTDTLLGVGTATPANSISVYRISTGALIRHIALGATPKDVNWEDGNRAYVLCTNGSILLVDVATGRVLSVMSNPVPATYPWRTVYEPKRKRLLWAEATPDDPATGASTLVVKGYRPVPVPASLTAPVFLSRPLAGHRIRAVTRAIGSVGEPVAGITVRGSLSTGNATLRNSSATTDGSGYAYFEIDCITAGTPVLTVQCEAN